MSLLSSSIHNIDQCYKHFGREFINASQAYEIAQHPHATNGQISRAVCKVACVALKMIAGLMLFSAASNAFCVVATIGTAQATAHISSFLFLSVFGHDFATAAHEAGSFVVSPLSDHGTLGTTTSLGRVWGSLRTSFSREGVLRKTIVLRHFVPVFEGVTQDLFM